MNRKIVAISTVVLFLALGFLYVNSSNLIANDKSQKKCCVDQTTSSSKKDVKAGGEQYSSYQFATEKACCQEMKSSLEKQLMGVGGVKEVRFSETCSASKMTMVTVMYSAGETNETQIANYLKTNSIDCPKSSGCDHEGCTSGEKSGEKSDIKSDSKMDGKCPHNGCDMKNKKTNGKEI